MFIKPPSKIGYAVYFAVLLLGVCLSACGEKKDAGDAGNKAAGQNGQEIRTKTFGIDYSTEFSLENPEQIVCGQDCMWAITTRLDGFIYRIDYKEENSGVQEIEWRTGGEENLVKLKVGEKCVEADGYGNGNAADDEKVRHLEYGLNALIHFADQQWPAALIWKEHTPMLLSLLEELGIDTSREFSLNGTKCIVENGRIGEAGNKWFIPSVAHDNALKRNEELLSKLLSTQK